MLVGTLCERERVPPGFDRLDVPRDPSTEILGSLAQVTAEVITDALSPRLAFFLGGFIDPLFDTPGSRFTVMM